MPVESSEQPGRRTEAVATVAVGKAADPVVAYLTDDQKLALRNVYDSFVAEY